jgi:hypothetical protein
LSDLSCKSVVLNHEGRGGRFRRATSLKKIGMPMAYLVKYP